MVRHKDYWKKTEWYNKINDDGKYLADLIYKYHEYFSRQDKKYRLIVRFLKIIVLLLAMISTVVLGLKTVITDNVQVIIGLIISALISFITALSSYFNFEEYWMRNISIHIQLNIIRDEFVFAIQSDVLDENVLKAYNDKLKKIQENNIEYWKKALKNV